MATRIDNLNAALDNIAKQLNDMTASPKPTYSAGGRQVSWGEHFNNLIQQQKALYEAIQMAGGPFEVVQIQDGC